MWHTHTSPVSSRPRIRSRVASARALKRVSNCVRGCFIYIYIRLDKYITSLLEFHIFAYANTSGGSHVRGPEHRSGKVRGDRIRGSDLGTLRRRRLLRRSDYFELVHESRIPWL